MLRFANVSGRASLRLLVHHDDPDREFDYNDGAEDALSRAADRGWTVISMKNDWNRIFADAPASTMTPEPERDPGAPT